MTEREFLADYQLNLEEAKIELLKKQEHSILVNGKAGSGKTFLLLARIAYLLESGAANEEQILNIAFSNELAKDMSSKYRYLYGENGHTPVFTDLHSFAYRLIRRYDKKNGKESWKAYRSMDKVVRRLIQDMFRLNYSKEEIKTLMAKVSYCRNMLLPMSEIENIQMIGIDFPAFYKAYEKFKIKRRIYDFDDVLVNAHRILSENAQFLEEVQEQYRFIHVDDGQELSFLSHLLIKMISAKSELFLCADEDVSIARDRCAFPQALTSFTHSYVNSQRVDLKYDYRHNKTITAAANRFYYKDDKEGLLSTSEEECELKFKGFADLTKLYAYALRKVKEDEEETVFLYRDSAMAVPLIVEFKEAGIPFSCDNIIEPFLQESYVHDMCNFIELLVDPRDMHAFYEVYTKLNLDISKRILLDVSNRLKEDEHVDIYQALMESDFKATGKKKLASLVEIIRIAEQQTTADMVRYILVKLDYLKQLEKVHMTLNHPVVLAFDTLAQRYENPEEFLYQLNSLSDFIAEVTSRVQIRSLAKCRGKEYARVCMIDCMQSIIPGKPASDADMEYERTLFYTGISRAKHQLEFFTSKKSGLTRLEISSFLYEIHEQKEMKEAQSKSAVVRPVKNKHLREGEIKRGVWIVHKTLGKGKIMKVHEGMMDVAFENDSRQLNIKMCVKNKLIELA